ncbi:MAG: hypothetical protein MZV63_23030 [Marinilabiliales bacterium]|nr:hypothetical protein [Marinilabiliales bacterium]
METGIAMAFAAVIHLTWHLGYYFGKWQGTAVNGQSWRSRAVQAVPPRVSHAVPLLMLIRVCQLIVTVYPHARSRHPREAERKLQQDSSCGCG